MFKNLQTYRRAKKNPRTNIRGFFIESIPHLNGGERGIRTLDTVSHIHAFQACSFNHSDISPNLLPDAKNGRNYTDFPPANQVISLFGKINRSISDHVLSNWLKRESAHRFVATRQANKDVAPTHERLELTLQPNNDKQPDDVRRRSLR